MERESWTIDDTNEMELSEIQSRIAEGKLPKMREDSDGLFEDTAELERIINDKARKTYEKLIKEVNNG